MIDHNTNKSWDIYLSSDPPKISSMYTRIINTGVFAVRNTKWSKNFVQRWFMNYDHNMWSYNNNSNNWACKKCDWAKDGYEQGEFNNLFYKNKFKEKEHILKMHWSMFASPDISEDGFIIHLMGQSNDVRTQFFTQVLN